jgi:putative membrane protein
MIGGIPIRNHGLQAVLQHKSFVALAIALLVHTVGLVGMVWIDRAWFASMTPVNLLLMSALLLWTQEAKDKAFVIIALLAFSTGMLAEITGVHTGLLFGDYTYGRTMGFGLFGVPVVIGLNWFVVVFSAACSATMLTEKLARLISKSTVRKPLSRMSFFSVFVAAMIAVSFDWIMEPAAVRLGFWTWAGDGEVPMLNYLTWFVLSFGLCTAMRYMRIVPRNVFAVQLLLIQAVFFMLVRWLL